MRTMQQLSRTWFVFNTVLSGFCVSGTLQGHISLLSYLLLIGALPPAASRWDQVGWRGLCTWSTRTSEEQGLQTSTKNENEDTYVQMHLTYSEFGSLEEADECFEGKSILGLRRQIQPWHYPPSVPHPDLLQETNNLHIPRNEPTFLLFNCLSLCVRAHTSPDISRVQTARSFTPVGAHSCSVRQSFHRFRLHIQNLQHMDYFKK